MKKSNLVVLFLAAALLLCLTACGGTQQTAPAPTPSGGTLMEENTEYGVNSPAFGSPTLTRGQILSITFLSDTADAPAESWDVSQEKNGSVIAWAVENGELYDLFIASDGGVIAPENCNYIFAYYATESITFNGAFDTSHVTDMSGMFLQCEKLATLDVSNFDTSSVTDMGGMFTHCYALTALDVSGFDTSNVTNMASMFSYCRNLTALDVSGFDTSNVTNMGAMFLDCETLTTLDVSGFNTSNVTKMAHMFTHCRNLTALDISGFNTSNVEAVKSMFYQCFTVTEEDVSKLDLSNATDADLIFSFNATRANKYTSDGRVYRPATSETSKE